MYPVIYMLILIYHIMADKARLPKADYFRERYKLALKQGYATKARYYKRRLIEMGEFIEVSTTTVGKLTRHELTAESGSIVFYSM